MMDEDEPKPKMSLEALLTTIQAFDDGMMTDIDPAQIVGDLKDKVDAIKSVLDRLKFQALWCAQQAEPFVKAGQACKNNMERLREYVTFVMKTKEFEELPGNAFKVVMHDNQPSLEIIKIECDATDFQKYPTYVNQVRRYEWNKEAIKTALVDARDKLLAKDPAAAAARIYYNDTIPFAKLTIDSHFKIQINKPVTVPAKVKAKKP